MCKVVLAFVFVLVYPSLLESKRELPSFLKVCKRHDPKLDDCIKLSVESLRPHLGKGIPAMKIPPFDPMHVTQLVFINGNSRYTYEELDFKKLDQFNLEKIHMDYDGCSASMDIFYTDLSAAGKYYLNGRLLAFDLEGQGQFSANFSSVHMSAQMNCTRIIKRSKEYANFTDIEFKIEIGDFHVQLDDLFTNNPELTARMNDIINENSQTLASEFEPLIAKSVESIVLATVKGVFDNFPLEELMPE